MDYEVPLQSGEHEEYTHICNIETERIPKHFIIHKFQLVCCYCINNIMYMLISYTVSIAITWYFPCNVSECLYIVAGESLILMQINNMFMQANYGGII